MHIVIDPCRRTRLRHASLGVAVVATAWTIAIAITGGGAVKLAGIVLSSRSIQSPALISVAAMALAIYLARPSAVALLIGDVRSVPRTAVQISPATYVLAVGIALRLWFWLLAPPMWLDEEMIAINLRGRSVTGLMGSLWLGQAAPFAG